MARKEKQYHFIYKTTNKLNGKYYYGMHSTNNLNDGYYGSGKRLRRSLNKYGKENHVVEYLEFLPDRKSLIEREKEIVNLNEIAKEDCMNLMVGGKGGFISEQALKGRYAADKILIEKYGENWRRVIFRKYFDGLSDEEKELIYQKMKKTNEINGYDYKGFLGKKHLPETIEKMKKSKNVGINNSQFDTCWIYSDEYSKPQKIKKFQLNEFINRGWRKGRK